MDQAATDQYQNQQLLSSTPAMLVYMLYDEAIRALGKTVEAIAADDVEDRWKSNNKAMEIITELAVTLDLERGGQIADRLYQLYTMMLTMLPDVDVRNDPKPAEDAIALLEPLRDSWRELAQQDTAELDRARAEAMGETALDAFETGGAKPDAPAADKAPASGSQARQALKISA